MPSSNISRSIRGALSAYTDAGPPEKISAFGRSAFAGSFHVFSIEWDSLGIRWFVDSTNYFSVAKSMPFDQRFHLLLNVAVGGNWPGSPNEMTVFPQDMIVDYVRVFQKK